MEKTVVIKPLITEKSFKDAQKGIYTFVVAKEAVKQSISSAIEKLFSVHVVSISTNIIKGKKHVAGKKRTIFKSPDIKKARVQLKKGEKIDVFEVEKSK